MRQRTDSARSHRIWLFSIRAGGWSGLNGKGWEIEVTGSISAVPLGSEYQNFLYAPICQDSEGMTLRVLSALARRDIDPWQEAERLAQLPKETAVEQITFLLDSVPHQMVATVDQASIAARLSALLPRRARVESSVFNAPIGGVTVQQTVVSMSVRFLLFYLFFSLMVNWLLAGRQMPPQSDSTSNTRAEMAPAREANNTKGESLNPTQRTKLQDRTVENRNVSAEYGSC